MLLKDLEEHLDFSKHSIKVVEWQNQSVSIKGRAMDELAGSHLIRPA